MRLCYLLPDMVKDRESYRVDVCFRQHASTSTLPPAYPFRRLPSNMSGCFVKFKPHGPGWPSAEWMMALPTRMKLMKHWEMIKYGDDE